MKKGLLFALLFIGISSLLIYILMKQESKKEKPSVKKIKFLIFFQLFIGILLVILTFYVMKKY